MLFYSIHTLDGRHFSRLTFAQLIAMLDCSVVSIEAGGDAGQHAENVIDESNRLIEEISKGRRAATLLRSIVNVFEEGGDTDATDVEEEEKEGKSLLGRATRATQMRALLLKLDARTSAELAGMHSEEIADTLKVEFVKRGAAPSVDMWHPDTDLTNMEEKHAPLITELLSE